MNVGGMSFIDAGASTGGFTDCLLQHGACRVIAVEAGRNQLDYRLRSDERVVVLENTSIIAVRSLPFVPEAAVADLSLRSLRKAAVHLLGLVSRKWCIALVKPQYEWRAPPADFEGIVSRTSSIASILEELFQDLQSEGVQVRRLAPSPLPGRKGNREFFCLLSSEEGRADGDLRRMVAKAVQQKY
jgi:23S rRNA (cytidine1920-2'-O)/16S rRNA (cytidine1409-2'-O)-methyltransferase